MLKKILVLSCMLFGSFALAGKVSAQDLPPLIVADPPPLVKRVDVVESEIIKMRAEIATLKRQVAAKKVAVPAQAVPAPVPFTLASQCENCNLGQCDSQCSQGQCVSPGQCLTQATIVQSAGVASTFKPAQVQYQVRTYTPAASTGGIIRSSGCSGSGCSSSTQSFRGKGIFGGDGIFNRGR